MKSETERHELLNILKAAVVYFALVFGAGFILGAYSNPFYRSTLRCAPGRIDGISSNARGHRVDVQIVGSQISTRTSRGSPPSLHPSGSFEAQS